MIVDVLYRADDGKRHGWRVMVRSNARPYVVTVWGNPEFYGLTNERAITEGLCRNTPTCARIIVIVWSRFMKERTILVGKCQHAQKHRHAIMKIAAV
jgi:hypothetical protein